MFCLLSQKIIFPLIRLTKILICCWYLKKSYWILFYILLKLVSAFFHSSFRSWDIRGFVFLSSPLLLFVRHCFRGWSKINLKVYDVTNCQNKNLITHFVWYLEKEKRYDIETLSIDRVLNKEHFYFNIMQKMCTRG